MTALRQNRSFHKSSFCDLETNAACTLSGPDPPSFHARAIRARWTAKRRRPRKARYSTATSSRGARAP